MKHTTSLGLFSTAFFMFRLFGIFILIGVLGPAGAEEIIPIIIFTSVYITIGFIFTACAFKGMKFAWYGLIFLIIADLLASIINMINQGNVRFGILTIFMLAYLFSIRKKYLNQNDPTQNS